MIYLLILCAVIFDFLNGFHDSSNVVATIISSRALSPRKALTMTAIAEFCGPFLFGVAVAKTIGSDIVDPQVMTLPIILAALVSSILWNLLTWFLGIPSSSSHALIGGIIGAISVGIGPSHILPRGLLTVIIALFISPFLGLFAGYLITRLVFFLSRRSSMRINWWFKNGQIITGIGLALSHGANDAQKTMGIITLGLYVSHYQSRFEVPFWVVVLSSSAIALGTITGGWRLIRTLGGKFYHIRPVHGFCAQIASASVILSAALLGGPVSTTQVVSSAILGAGSAERINKVRWGVARNIVLAWLITIPASALASALLTLLFNAWL